MVQPIGVAVVGGLSSSTFVTLFFIPVLYSLVMREKKTTKSKIQVMLTLSKDEIDAMKNQMISSPNEFSDYADL